MTRLGARWWVVGWVVAVLSALAGCSGDDDELGNLVPSPTWTAPVLTTPTLSPSPTATATPAPTIGPRVSYFALARADGVVLEPSGTNEEGVPIYVRPAGAGFYIVVEGAPGVSGAPVGLSTFQEDLASLPDLQIVASRALGDGSLAVCDVSPPGGGVPAVEPADFSATPEITAAINDFACRFRDGEGKPSGVGPADACTLFPSGDFGFVNPASTVQYCAQVSRLMSFPVGDTVLSVRLRDILGNVGPTARIVVRVQPPATAPPSPTATPTLPPVSAQGPVVTFLGITRADGTLVEPTDVTDDGTPVYTRRGGFGFGLVIEGKPGTSGKPVSPRTFQPDLVTFPDLQIWTSRDLGNGSPEVCDRAEARPGATPVAGGGVPATNPVNFELSVDNIARVNDFACRFRDGQDQPFGRYEGEQCMLLASGDYGFASQESQVQFCAMVDAAIAFPTGETLITVRLRDVDGNVGPSRSMIVRVL
ncbi:MAG: hypothetical protein N3C12_00495 [Candidatus Binatia bacterium]|nr:hypothetical protein [Candidatus Binatia bacterium]